MKKLSIISANNISLDVIELTPDQPPIVVASIFLPLSVAIGKVESHLTKLKEKLTEIFSGYKVIVIRTY